MIGKTFAALVTAFLAQAASAHCTYYHPHHCSIRDVVERTYFDVTVCNRTNRQIVYTIVGFASEYAPPRSCTRYTGAGQAIINFDESTYPGVQNRNYTLSDGTYGFQMENQVKIRLYRN